jgi:hypothetical protein
VSTFDSLELHIARLTLPPWINGGWVCNTNADWDPIDPIVSLDPMFLVDLPLNVNWRGGGIQIPDPPQEPPVPGTVPVPPIPPPPLPQPQIPKGSPKDFVKAMNRAFADLEERLRSRPACAAVWWSRKRAEYSRWDRIPLC